MEKLFYIKERSNPQLDKPYYVALGQLSKPAARKHAKTLYGQNSLLSYATQEEYITALKDLETKGFSVNNQ